MLHGHVTCQIEGYESVQPKRGWTACPCPLNHFCPLQDYSRSDCYRSALHNVNSLSVDMTMIAVAGCSDADTLTIHTAYSVGHTKALLRDLSHKWEAHLPESKGSKNPNGVCTCLPVCVADLEAGAEP